MTKFATLPGPGRDGSLVVVSTDLTRAASAAPVAVTLIDAVERWRETEFALLEISIQLERGEAPGEFEFDSGVALAPLPRSPQWLDGSVFQSHLELMAKALHPDRPHQPSPFPLMYQGASDDFQGSRSEIGGYLESEGIDFEGEFGVVVDDVPIRTNATDALAHVRLILLLNDVSLRSFAGREIGTGFGFLNAKPSTAFAPVAVTPDELGDAWHDGRIHLPINVALNGDSFGHPHGGEMTFGFGELIEHAARTRRLSAGTIIGSGTVSNDDRSVGSACIAERRAIEIIEHGAPRTAFMSDGDRVVLDVCDDHGHSIFGPIEQRVTTPG